MAKKKYEETNIQAIADTIRDKTGTTKTYKTSDMASGIEEVYDAGKAMGQADFMKMLSNDCKRTLWRYVFEGTKFDGYTFNPILYPTRLGSIFYNYVGKSLPSGIDFSNAIIAESVTDTAVIPYQMFAYCNYLEEIPDLNIPVQYKYTYTYRNCGALKKIDVIRVEETTQFSNTFTGCSSLEEVTIDGTIGSSIHFAPCPLTVASMKNIISCLKNYGGTSNDGVYKITFSDTCWTALEDSGPAPDGGTWQNYVTAVLGWSI